MFRKFLLFLLLITPSFVYAEGLPFTDVSSQTSYYSDLKYMFDAGVISDTSDHFFHPDGLLPRDEFVAITVGVSCQKCITPSIADILHYTSNPFVDILKTNKYFYCISYAKEKEIVRGYTLDATGNTQCQNNQTFSQVPFCPANNITRIEAVAVLLRQAGLWNDLYNSNPYTKNLIIQDVDTYWYGYAQKAVESGLITLSIDKKIFPNEYITRKEFVLMASKIFTINMCSVKNNAQIISNFASIIKIFDAVQTPASSIGSPVTTFPNSTQMVYDFGGYATGSVTNPLQYNWTFTNTTTGVQQTATGNYLDNFNLGSTGSWIVQLVVTDANGNTSTSYQQVFVGSASSNTSTGISVQIGTSSPLSTNTVNNGNINTAGNTNTNNNNGLGTTASSLNGIVGVPVPFTATATGGVGNYTYSWNFGDGTTSTAQNPSHIFTTPGVYPVSVTVYDAAGNIAYAQLVVLITANLDPDGDGILNYDAAGNLLDMCPNVFGPLSNKGCPLVVEYGSGNIIDGNNTTSVCLSDKIQSSGIIQGNVQCATCPCQYASDFIATVRSCDIIFPSIISPDKKTLYSRGSIFPIP
ncbi:MAG: PKD domain-containing protein [Candidatus Gracilibacteria bacterium]